MHILAYAQRRCRMSHFNFLERGYLTHPEYLHFPLFEPTIALLKSVTFEYGSLTFPVFISRTPSRIGKKWYYL